MRASSKLFFVLTLCTLLLPFIFNEYSLGPSKPFITTALLPAPTVEPRILFFSQFADNNREANNTLQAVNSTHGTSYTLTNLTSYTNLVSELPNHDILLIPEQELIYQENITDIATAWQTPLNTFLSQGGIVIVLTYFSVNFGPVAAAHILNDTGLMSFQGSTPVTGSPITIHDAFDPLAHGVVGFSAPSGAVAFQTTETGIVANASIYPIVLHKQISLGHVVLMGLDFFDRDPESDELLGNAIRLYQPPSAPVLNDPGTTIDSFLVPLTWSTATDTDGIIDHYEYQASAYPDFSSIGQTDTSNTTIGSFVFLSNGTYFFRVRAIDNNSLAGPWSNVENATVTGDFTFPGIPGFPIEAIAIGLVLSMGAIFIIRRRKQPKVSS